MSDKSPLFVSSVELLSHAIELYGSGEERKFKFVILHLANAIELILKDRLIDAGKSIYVHGRSITINIWDSFDNLCEAGIDIQERPIIELLIDDRNTIQHRFGFPNAETVFFYLDQVVHFFRRFLEEEYSVDLVDTLSLYLSDEQLEIIGLVEKEEEKYEYLDKLFELSPESAVMQAYKLLESKFMSLIPVDKSFRGPYSAFWKSPDFPHLLDDLVIEGYFSHNINDDFQLVRHFRNRAAHSQYEAEGIRSSEWTKVLTAAKGILEGLDKAIDEDLFSRRVAKKRQRASSEVDTDLIDDKNNDQND